MTVRRSSGRPPLLFYTNDLREAMAGRERAVVSEVESMAESQILGANVEELASYLYERHRFEPPVLNQDAIEVSQAETEKDVSQDPNRVSFHIRSNTGPHYIPATAFTYHIPFEGDASLFHSKASTFNYNPPAATVHESELHVVFVRAHDESMDVKAAFDRELDNIQKHLAWVTNDANTFNAGLLAKGRAAVESRRARLLANQKTVTSLGYPVRRRDGAPRTYAVPEVRRKLVLPPTPRPSSSGAPEPALDDANYEHILSVMTNMVAVMERSPESFRTMDEEAIRQHFLMQLNGQYEGQATGETFNFEGKTDILIRAQGKNLFIGECKFWDGPKALDAAIDQLLSYASWRDTKTAIVLFNRSRNLTSVVRKVPEVVMKRAQFVRAVPYESETGFRYVLHHRDDAERELVLTVLVFEVPA